MKKLVLFLVALAPVFAKEKVLPEPKQIVPVTQLDGDFIQGWIQGTCPEDIAIEFPQGTSIPLRMLCRTKLFSVAYTPNLTITVDKLCYLRLVKKKAYLSHDLVTWKKPHDSDFFGTSDAKVTLDPSGLLIETTSGQ